MRMVQVLLALLVATSLPTGVQASSLPKRPSALAVEMIDDQTSALVWSGPAGNFRARAIKLNRRGEIRPSTARTCVAELSEAGAGRCAVARLSPGRWRIRVTNLTGGGVATRTKVIVVPIMQGLPTSFAPCAGEATSVKEAAYNCLRDWKPAMETYPGKVVYHFSPSITASEKAAIREATEFALVRAEGYITTAGFAPEFHLFYNMDDWKACKKLLKSWAGTADNTWLYAGEGVAGSGALCSPNGFGGRGIDPSLPGTAVAAMSTPRNHEVFGDWVFPYYTYRVLPHEVVSSMPFAIGESRLGSVWAGLNVAPRWIGYAASRAAWQSAGIQLLNDDLEDFHNGLLPQPGAATWQPTVSDPRFGPVPEDFQGLMSETPWVYAVMDLASQYMTAMFGPDWIQKVLFPIMVSEETHVNNITAFRLEADRVAQRLWGGKWSELESAVDDYVLSEFRAAGITGLE